MIILFQKKKDGKDEKKVRQRKGTKGKKETQLTIEYTLEVGSSCL